MSTKPTTRAALLIVDVHAPLRRALRRLLHGLGVDIHVAATGADAVGLLDRHPRIAAIITDQNVGTGPTGLELIAEAQRRHPGVAALLYTSERLLLVEVWRDRFVTVIAKPAPVGRLRRAIEAAVARS